MDGCALARAGAIQSRTLVGLVKGLLTLFATEDLLS